MFKIHEPFNSVMTIEFVDVDGHSINTVLENLKDKETLNISGKILGHPREIFTLVEYCRKNNIKCCLLPDSDIYDEEIKMALDPYTYEYVEVIRRQ